MRDFESKSFRTLRDLLVPGRVALNFLKGHRVGYVRPLRLFVMLTLFTFFVGKLTLHVDNFGANGDSNLFAQAQTAAEVETLQAAELAKPQQRFASEQLGGAALGIGIGAINAAAAQRLAQLGDSTSARALDRAGAAAARASGDRPFTYEINGKPWHPQSNPVVLKGWPDFVSS